MTAGRRAGAPGIPRRNGFGRGHPIWRKLPADSESQPGRFGIVARLIRNRCPADSESLPVQSGMQRLEVLEDTLELDRAVETATSFRDYVEIRQELWMHRSR